MKFRNIVTILADSVNERGKFSDLCKKLKAKMLNENETVEDSGLLFIFKVLENSNNFRGRTGEHLKVLLSKDSMSKIL